MTALSVVRGMFALILGFTASIALMATGSNAASSTDNPKVNVFFRYGVPPITGDDYFSEVRVYNSKTDSFQENISGKYGGIYRKGKVIVAHVNKDEKIVSTDVSYKLVKSGKSVKVRWSGKKSLSITRTINGHKAKLVVAVVNVHNNRLPNQVQPTVTGATSTTTVG